jgi:hypothetical protein
MDVFTYSHQEKNLFSFIKERYEMTEGKRRRREEVKEEKRRKKRRMTKRRKEEKNGKKIRKMKRKGDKE